jgi:hypothetical protein
MKTEPPFHDYLSRPEFISVLRFFKAELDYQAGDDENLEFNESSTGFEFNCRQAFAP